MRKFKKIFVWRPLKMKCHIYLTLQNQRIMMRNWNFGRTKKISGIFIFHPYFLWRPGFGIFLQWWNTSLKKSPYGAWEASLILMSLLSLALQHNKFFTPLSNRNSFFFQWFPKKAIQLRQFLQKNFLSRRLNIDPGSEENLKRIKKN